MAAVRKEKPSSAIDAMGSSRYDEFFSCSKAIFQIGYEPHSIDVAIREGVEYFRHRGTV